MAEYMIEKWDGGCCIARDNGNGDYDMWRSYDCKWVSKDNFRCINNAWGAFLGFEDGFHDISEEEALKIIRQYEQKNKQT